MGDDQPMPGAPGEVTDNKALGRYELVENGHIAFAEYHLEMGRIIFPHTVVPPEIGGRGVGSRLVAGALADARKRGLEVEAPCSFVAAYMRRNPDA